MARVTKTNLLIWFQLENNVPYLIRIFLCMEICISKTIDHNSEQITKYQITLIISTDKNNETKRETDCILLTNLEQSVKTKSQTL